MDSNVRAKKRATALRLGPLAVLICVGIILTALGVNQSSVGMYTAEPSASVGWGVDRPIRSDEWFVRLPWLVGQESRGFPSRMFTAGNHDPSVTYDLPVHSLQMVLKPHLIPYLFLGIDRAIAAEWWFLVLGCAAAVYILLLTLRIRPVIAGAVAVLVASSPGLHWWTVSSSFDIVIYACLGAAAMISALNANTPRKRYSLSAIGGWLFACSAVVLYPPFQVPTLVCAGLLVLVVAVDSARTSTIAQVVRPLAAAGFLFVACVGWFVMSHRAGLGAMASTVYPGTRRSAAGGVNVQSMLGVPFDLRASSIVSGSVNRTNQSENSSTFLIAGVALLMFPGLKDVRSAGLAGKLLLFVGGWFALLVSWMLLPLPSIVGRVTLLDRVPPDRLKPSVALVSGVVLALFLENFARQTPTARKTVALAGFSVVTVWAGSQYLVNDAPLARPTVWFLAMLWLVPTVMAFGPALRTGIVALAVVSVFTSAHINPIHTSVSPVRDNALYAAILRADPDRTSPWITFTGSAQVRGVMVATGAHVESAVSPYPDPAFWSRFDPVGMYESAWNRYAHVHMVQGTGRTSIRSPQSDVVEVSVDPCSVGSPIESGTYFVESSADSIPCAQTVSRVTYLGTEWYVLRKG